METYQIVMIMYEDNAMETYQNFKYMEENSKSSESSNLYVKEDIHLHYKSSQNSFEK